MKEVKSPPNSGSSSSSWPQMTSPVEPLMEIQSPSETVTSPLLKDLASSSMVMSLQPATQGFPQPRATTAA